MDRYIIKKPRLGVGFEYSSTGNAVAVPSTSTNIICKSGGDGKREDKCF